MKLISLTCGKFAIVDDEDYERLIRHKWHARQIRGNWYAQRNSKQGLLLMHREILGLVKGDGKETDHRNHNCLDNQKSNIRVCTTSQNQQNRKKHRGNSVFKGVSWNKRIKKWQSQIMKDYKNKNLGFFNNEIETARAYDKAAEELFGEYANINFPRL